MLTNSSAGTAYAKAMAAATARDGAVEALIDVLGPKPRWSDLYWRSIIGEPGSYVNAAKLRIPLARVPWQQIAIEPKDTDLGGAEGKSDGSGKMVYRLEDCGGCRILINKKN